MEKRKYSINETLFISESEEWVYITADNKTYKVKLTVDELKKLYDIIKNIKNKTKVDINDIIFKFLAKINGIITEQEIPKTQKEIVISYVENIDDIESGYNIIRKYWKILRNNSTYFTNSINNINTIRI